MLQKKVCMLGVSAVGKTSLVQRFVMRRFTSDVYKTTIGVTVDKKPIQLNGKDVTLVLWDIHGEDVFEKIWMSQLRGMAGYLLVADGTRRQTLEDALTLNDRVTATMGKLPAILVLNKCDLTDQWEVEPSRETELSTNGWKILHTSAKTGENVEEAYSSLALAMLGS